MRYVLFWSLLVATAVSLSPSAASQQDRQIGSVGLTLFADRDFRGRSATIREDMPDFRSINMNDVAQSLRVGPGEQWEVCEHINYQGRCVVVSGAERDLRTTGWNRIISSARRVRGGRGGRGVAPGVLELFSRTGFSGDRRTFSGPDSDLRRTGFNDVAQSLRVPPGQSWQVCADANFGNCLVVNTDWRDLTGLSMSRRISSVRPWQQQGGGGGAVPRGHLILFSDTRYRGQSFRVDGDTPVMQGFANRARSVQVNGGSWQLCDRASFAGRCVPVSANLPDLSSIGLSRRVASVRRAPTPR